MITINSKTYNDYYDVCTTYKIDFREFLDHKIENPNISELDLLGHFIPNIAYCMSDGSYIIKDKH